MIKNRVISAVVVVAVVIAAVVVVAAQRAAAGEQRMNKRTFKSRNFSRNGMKAQSGNKNGGRISPTAVNI